MDQLEFYTRTRGADGYGIYLAYWFGEALKVRTVKKANSATELEKTLKRVVADQGLDKTEIVVIDVSKRGRHI